MALNPYSSSLDPLAGNIRTQIARYGEKIGAGERLEPSDTIDFDEYVLAVLITTGDVKFLPAINDASDPITMVGLPAGYIIPFQMRRVFVTGTTASLRAISKVY